mmetsp:Transcript_5961/g.18677  ORF Transcript_5961/g.18677 Transcript_5961/m.18677 type:complete len:86 (+) Transcript_5961:1747-2004(+)
MKGEVSIAPSGGVLIKKGLSTKAALRAFGSGTVLGVGVGFVGGFALAQAIYSDEYQRETVKRTVKITAGACGVLAVLGVLSSLRR